MVDALRPDQVRYLDAYVAGLNDYLAMYLPHIKPVEVIDLAAGSVYYLSKIGDWGGEEHEIYQLLLIAKTFKGAAFARNMLDDCIPLDVPTAPTTDHSDKYLTPEQRWLERPAKGAIQERLGLASLIDFQRRSAETQAIDLEFGTSGKFDGITTFGGVSNAAVTKQNGYTAGTLSSLSIGRDGTIDGIYTNGQLRALSKIMMATFDNPAGLESVGDGIWAATVNSGDAVLGPAKSGRAGAISSSALEGSNVQSAEELTKLIIAQYGFQLSTRAMSVSNRIINELANII